MVSVPPFVSSVADAMVPLPVWVDVSRRSSYRMLAGSDEALVQLKKPLKVSTALVIVFVPMLMPSNCQVYALWWVMLVKAVVDVL